MGVKYSKNQKITTYNSSGEENGFLVPIFNENDNFLNNNDYLRQVYLTVVKPNNIKGPHLHYKRNGLFTCIKGNIRIVTKENNEYKLFFSGEDYNYNSILIPKGIPAALQNISDIDAMVINLPSPGWTKEMQDEHSADFSDFDFKKL
jgi:dTDP-4-dehydrorhamnose 3,5-epimerase